MPVGNTMGQGIFAQVRYGDEQATSKRPLTVALPLSYSYTSSQHAVATTLTYTVQRANTAPLLLYYVVGPTGAFAINGDSTIISPDQVVHTPRPVAARSLVASPVIQGYKSMTWTYSTLQLSEYAQILSYYNPQNPVVLLTYPDENGMWAQRSAVMHPPVYGSQRTQYYYSVTLTFTRLN